MFDTCNSAELHLADCVDILPQIPSRSVDLVLADIPYGEVQQASGGLRKLNRGNADVCDFDLVQVMQQVHRVGRGSYYIFCGTEQISPLVSFFREHKLTTRVGAWEKTNPSPMNGKRLWLSGMEFCVFARRPKATFNESCKKALWAASSGRSKRHPTEKPLPLMERLVLASTEPADTVLDFTMGSGTTGVACVRTGRRFIGIEREPEYFSIAESRINEAEIERLLS